MFDGVHGWFKRRSARGIKTVMRRRKRKIIIIISNTNNN
jgi:hypothetical protein